MMDKEAFIHFRSDGSVRISGGLVFCRGYAVYAEQRVASWPEHQCEQNTFVTRLPRWWQVRRWLQLLRELKAHTVDA